MVGEVEQLQERGAAAIRARANFLHHAHDMIAVHGGVILQRYAVL
jgi:Holliday junction resolvase